LAPQSTLERLKYLPEALSRPTRTGKASAPKGVSQWRERQRWALKRPERAARQADWKAAKPWA